MVPYAKVKVQVIVLGTGQKLTSGNSKLSLPSNSMCHRKIPTHSFCPVHKSNNSDFTCIFWVITMARHSSFDIWSIPPRLEVLPLTQNCQTEQKEFDSKMPGRCLHLYTAQITSLQLSQVTLQPEFNLNNVTCIYTSICSIMFYYSGGDLRYEWTTLITWFVNRETSQICSSSHSTPTHFTIH